MKNFPRAGLKFCQIERLAYFNLKKTGGDGGGGVERKKWILESNSSSLFLIFRQTGTCPTA